MKITVNQDKKVLLGDPIVLNIETDALENVQVFLRRYYYDGDVDYSFGIYEPVNGIVNTGRSRPIGGTYTVADPSGLFWSQANTSFEMNEDIQHLSELTEEDKGCFVFDVFQDKAHQVFKYEIIRQSDDVEEIALDKVDGKLFVNKSSTDGGVLIHLAGEPGIEGIEINGKLLASKGITTVVLPICQYGSLPEEFKEISLNHMMERIDYIKTIDGVDPNRLALIGGTRGAELALLIASMRSDIKLLVASNPCDVVNQSVVKQLGKPKSSWTLDGQSVSFSKVKKSEIIKLYLSRIVSKRSFSMKNVYQHDEQMIDCSKITAKTLLLAGRHDERWDSVKMAKRIQKSLPCEMKLYDSGQILGGPGCLPTTSFDYLAFGLGGTCEGNGISQNRSWHDIIDFIKTHL